MPDKNMAVIINTCNRPFLLKSLIEQLQPQLVEEDVIIIVNDGDPESLPEFEKGNIYEIEHCKDYYAVASGRNRGIEKAIDLGYEWGLILDDDMEVFKNLIKEHKLAWSNKSTAYAGKITEAGENRDARKKWWNGKGDFVVKWGGCNMSCHLSSLIEAGGYNENFDGEWGSEDNELFYRLREKYDWQIKYLENAVVNHLKAPVNGNYQRYGNRNKDKLEKGATYSG